MKEPFISILVSCYNEEEHIQQCLVTLLNQSYKNKEIIVVDDGSTDKTDSILNLYKEKVKILKLHHVGTAVSRNTGAKEARGEILVIVDADMEFDEHFIENLTRPIRDNKSKGTFSKKELVKNWNNPLARCWNRMNEKLPDRFRIPQDIEVGDDFRAILKKEFDRVHGFDNTGYTDTWSLKRKLGYNPTNAPEAVYYHYNPDTYQDIFNSARWIGKRKYKYGLLGTLFAIIRANLVFALMKGIVKAIRYKEPSFVMFHLVYDFGITSGAIDSLINKSVIK